MTTPAPSPLNWRKATASQGSQGCVELAPLPGLIAVRDSKDPDGPTMFLARDAWRRLTEQANRGNLDL
ncbi:DUF397 domain-containing protein [Actinomadura sp. 6K520]|uniref:DUF397 domain-containing protein n=1 Tax=Actinomadura sp. 6K520 TaxID=2530364 RepID=UPI001048A1EB|nr:DUF397 domain-containing protein [Actinomadura sp. 6K520]TDE29991.1 DUF397 domain-containing protein [Actinomadura sp. 6K520]